MLKNIFKIQQKYDEMYERKYRLVLLNASNMVIYKAPLHGKIKFTLYLFFHCNHFDVLLNPGLFFWGKKCSYSFWILTMYD